MYVYLSSPLVDAGQIDSRDELDGWGCVRVVLATVYVEAVYTVLMCTLEREGSVGVPGRVLSLSYMRGAEYGSVPVGHQ